MSLSVQDREILRARIAPLVTAELMVRARAKPSPPYDPDIVEVLDFVRRNPDPELARYVIVATRDGFAVGARRQPPGSAPALVDENRYPDRDAAEYAVLEHRLHDYGLTW